MSVADPSSACEHKSCPWCAEQIMATAIKCKHCGAMLVPLPPSAQPGAAVRAAPTEQRLIYPRNPPHDPTLMAIFSGLLIFGLGQMVVGQVSKGLVILVGNIVLACCTMGISLLVTWPLGAVDAYLIAKKLREGRPVGEWEFF
jgi:TM2 domain-containing membrane protein YozV